MAAQRPEEREAVAGCDIEAVPLRMSDGFVLACRRWHPREAAASPASAIVVCLHGLGSHGGCFGRLAPLLCLRGAEVWAPDLRGFGDSVEPGLRRGDVARFSRVVRDIPDIVAAVRRGAPLFLLAHSLGAALALPVLADPAAAVRGAMLLAPAVRPLHRVSPAQLVRGLWDAALAPHRPVEVYATFPGFAETPEYRLLVADPLATTGVASRVGVRLLAVTSPRAVLARCRRVRVPTVILQGDADAQVAPAGAREAAARLARAGGALHILPGADHYLNGVLLPGAPADAPAAPLRRVADLLGTWMAEHGGAGPPAPHHREPPPSAPGLHRAAR